MTFHVTLTDQAELDLRRIFEYIAFNLLVPEYAARQLNRLEEHIMKLADMPEKFRLHEKEPWRSKGFHQMPVDNFIVFYIAEEENRTVTVIRIMYSGRDIDTQLRETL